MSCSYADGLSPYSDKGIIGVPEKFDEVDSVNAKCLLLSEWIGSAKHVVVHTGAGISTAAGIPDFRGPKGVWTLEKQGLKPEINVAFDEAVPTKTHMALKKLLEVGYIKYIVSQNIDGLHLRSGLRRNCLSELHGNMFVEQCDTCDRQYVRNTATTSVGQKCLDKDCPRQKLTGRRCRGKICDTILDWEASLPDTDLKLAQFHSSTADLNICLGTTLQIVPSGNLPLSNKKSGGRLAIVNLQPTKHDKKSDLLIHTYVDAVLEKVMKHLGLEIPEFSQSLDPSKSITDKPKDWTLTLSDLKEAKRMYNTGSINGKKRKQEDDGGEVKKEKSEIAV